MKRSLIVAVPLLVVLLAGAPAVAAVSVPEQDPFYTVPAGIADYDNGEIIASRSITAIGLSGPLPARAWQIKYRTTDSKGPPSATVTTVLLPLLPWLRHEPRP